MQGYWRRLKVARSELAPAPCEGASATYVAWESKVVTFGGMGQGGVLSNGICCLNLDKLEWNRPEILGNPPEGRYRHNAMAWEARKSASRSPPMCAWSTAIHHSAPRFPVLLCTCLYPSSHSHISPPFTQRPGIVFFGGYVRAGASVLGSCDCYVLDMSGRKWAWKKVLWR